MKIAILTPTFSGFSGPDRVAWNEVEELSRTNEVTVICFSADMKHPRADMIVLGSPKNRMLERLYKLFFFLDIFTMCKIILKLRGHGQIIAFLYPMTITAMVGKLAYGVKYTYYDVGLAHPELFTRWSERVAMRFIKVMTMFSIFNADNAISISNYCRQELRKSSRLHSTVKYVHIDRKRFHRHVDKRKITAVRRKYMLGSPTFLYIGRISPHKGVHLLLNMFKIVKKSYPRAKLLVVGKHTFPDYSRDLKTEAGPGVIFTGFVPDEDLPYYYGACDIYVTASLWEGFDMPLVEAQACGKMVVAFGIGSHPEVVKKGRLVQPGDVKGFALAVNDILRARKKKSHHGT